MTKCAWFGCLAFYSFKTWCSLNVKSPKHCPNYRKDNIRSKNTAGAHVARDSKGSDLTDGTTRNVTFLVDEARGFKDCSVEAPDVNVQVGCTHGKHEDFSLRNGNGFRPRNVEHEVVTSNSGNACHVKTKSLIPRSHEPGTFGTNIGKVQSWLILVLFNIFDLFDFLENNLDKIRICQEVTCKPYCQCAGRRQKAQSRDHLDVVVVWVILPVWVTGSYNVDAVASGLDTGFTVLKVKFAKSLKKKLARLPSRVCCEPRKGSSKCIKRLAEFPSHC
ncbi:hypothetical protein HG531_012619 [Fusarium graminearum]|nr:hypothetical protein HG531_012619 [Fusarium graminearum]